MTGEEDLTAWLRRRISERRFLAGHAVELGANPEWTEQSSGVLVTGEPPDGSSDAWFGTWAMGDSTLTRLMEANDPRDTIARCEAELGILDEHGPVRGVLSFAICQRCGYVASGRSHRPREYPCPTVRFVAAGYRYWPGYQEAWKP